MAQVVEHKTYVATRCATCHEPADRVCILHDGCEFNRHDARECNDAMALVQLNRKRLVQYAEWLAERGFAQEGLMQ